MNRRVYARSEHVGYIHKGHVKDFFKKLKADLQSAGDVNSDFGNMTVQGTLDWMSSNIDKLAGDELNGK